jgi:hypothetical protein
LLIFDSKDGRKAKVSKAEVDETLEKFLNRFYKENQEVPLSKFIKIKENFRREIYQFEVRNANGKGDMLVQYV